MAQTVISKLEYARLRGRDPSAVSHWIKTGKLTAPALVGEGRSARINVELADAQLAATLSLGHQVGNAIRETGREIIAPATPDPPPADPETPPEDPTKLSDQQRLLRHRADREELAAHEAFIAAKARDGTWIDRAESDREHGRRLAETVSAIERWLPTLAQAVAATCAADPRALTVLMRDKFRDLRATLAKEAREAAETG